MSVFNTRRKNVSVQVALALLPVSVCAADLNIADGENLSALLADNRPGVASAPTIKFSNDNIIVNGSVNIDSGNITAAQAEYIVHAYGHSIDLGQGTYITSENSANILAAGASADTFPAAAAQAAGHQADGE